MKRYTSGILIKGNAIVIGKRSKMRALYPEVWDFIGGHCHDEESYEEGRKIEGLKLPLSIDTYSLLTFTT